MLATGVCHREAGKLPLSEKAEVLNFVRKETNRMLGEPRSR